MKRNRLFMWAYICFIVIATILRLFTSYVLWQAIVVAVTVSGIFFALEQLFSVLYNKYLAYADTFTLWIAETEDTINENLVACSEQLKIAESLIPIESIMEENANLFRSLISMLNSAQEPVNQAKATLNDFQKKKHLFSSLTTAFAFTGFLSLFVTLIICSKIVVSQLLQDILTVIPFSIILATQQIEPILLEKADTCFKVYQDSLVEQRELNKKAKKLLHSFQKLHSTIKSRKGIEE